MDFYTHASLHGGNRKRLRVLGRETGRGDILLRQHRRVGRVSVPKDQNRFCNAVAAQVAAFAQAAYCKGCGTGLLQNPGRDCVAVAVGICLDNGTDRPADCLLNVGKIMADRVQVNFRPAVFFKIHIQSPLYNLFSLSYSFKKIL